MNTSTSPSFSRPIAVGLIGSLVTGAFVLAQLALQGHAAFNTTSDGLMWGLPIVTYDFFMMTSCGLTLVASLWTVFGLKDFAPIARRAQWLALPMMLGGVTALFLELGYPLRSLYAIPLNFQVRSPLFWKVLFISAYGASLAGIVAGWLFEKSVLARFERLFTVVALVSAPLVIFTGALMFATISMRPLWFSGEVPAMFFVESVLGGLALVLLATYAAHGFGYASMEEDTRRALAGPLPRVTAALLAGYLLFEIGRLTVGLASNLDGMQVWRHVAASPLYWGTVAVGLLLPLWWMASARSRENAGTQVAALVLLLLALFIGKYEFVINGQVIPLFKGSWVHGLIPYAPSATEWALLALSAFLAYAIYVFGAAFIRLESR